MLALWVLVSYLLVLPGESLEETETQGDDVDLLFESQRYRFKHEHVLTFDRAVRRFGPGVVDNTLSAEERLYSADGVMAGAIAPATDIDLSIAIRRYFRLQESRKATRRIKRHEQCARLHVHEVEVTSWVPPHRLDLLRRRPTKALLLDAHLLHLLAMFDHWNSTKTLLEFCGKETNFMMQKTHLMTERGFGAEHGTTTDLSALHVSAIFGARKVAAVLVEEEALLAQTVAQHASGPHSPLSLALQWNAWHRSPSAALRLLRMCSEARAAGDTKRDREICVRATSMGHVPAKGLSDDAILHGDHHDVHPEREFGSLYDGDFQHHQEHRQLAMFLAEHEAVDVDDSHIPATHRAHPPLHLAAEVGDHEVVHALLRRGATPDLLSHGGHGDSALHRAARDGHAQVVHLLLRHKASSEVLSISGETPADVAHRDDHTVRTLIKNWHSIQKMRLYVTDELSDGIITQPEEELQGRELYIHENDKQGSKQHDPHRWRHVDDSVDPLQQEIRGN